MSAARPPPPPPPAAAPLEPPPVRAEVDALAPGLIHEMRHPLLGIKAGAQLLEDALGAALEGREEWALLKGQLGRLEELFRNYQDFLQPAAAAPGPLVLQAEVERVLGLLAFQLKRLGGRLVRELPQAPVQAWATPAAVTHALTNLLLNALDALEAAGGKGRLALRVLPAGPSGRAQVRVSDEGVGLAPAVRARLFEPGVTTKAHGTGLGLSIARRMAEAVGGALLLSEPGDPLRLGWAATEFVLEVPCAAAREAPAPPARPGEAAPRPRAAPRGPRALVVDDEPVVLLVLRRVLERLGVHVTEAAHGEAARERLEREHFDLLVTDKNLPGPDGVALARLARARDPDVRIALVTAYASAESASALLGVGVDAYLEKPFSLGALEAELARLLALPPPGRAAAPAPGGGGVLLVERDEAARAALAHALERLGRTPRPTADLSRALDSEPPPEAVLASAALLRAGTDARGALQALRARAPHVPVVVLSEPGSLADGLAALSVGARAQLHYPLGDTGALDAALLAALGEVP